MRIQLLCAGGFSSSMLVSRISEAAKAAGVDAEVSATAFIKATQIDPDVDVILVGPQVAYLVDKYRPEADRLGIPLAVMPMTDYGRMDGAKMFALAQRLVAERDAASS